MLTPGPGGQIEGLAFSTGCADTGTSTAWGCSVDEGETEKPMQDVDLRIRQKGQVWVLGSADAGTAEENRLGHVSWTVRLPDGLRPGRATLVADEADPLRIKVLRRGGS